MIEVRRCTDSEVPKLMSFIDKYWRRGHSLATSRALMDWQHRAEPAYHFLLAWDGDQLLGVLGYIPTRRYDDFLSKENVLWLSLWKIQDNCRVTGLGLRMLRALEQLEPHVAIAVNGINFTHPPMYKALGYHTAELSQFYMINPAKPRHLLQGPASAPRFAGAATCKALTEDDLQRFLLPLSATPHKTPQYFIERFLRHPFYQYHVYLLEHGGMQALVATRSATHEGHNALRIVDFAGDPNVLAESGNAFSKLMEQYDSEYVDFWQHGLPNELLDRAGFEVVNADDPIIVPNYYEPFISENGRIICAYKKKTQTPFIVCRADGDQDRPNQLGKD